MKKSYNRLEAQELSQMCCRTSLPSSKLASMPSSKLGSLPSSKLGSLSRSKLGSLPSSKFESYKYFIHSHYPALLIPIRSNVN